MKKTIILLIISVTAIALLVSCANNNENQSNISTEPLPVQHDNNAPEAEDIENSTLTEPFKSSVPPERPAPEYTVEPDTIGSFSYYLDERIPAEVREVVIKNRSRLFVNENVEITEHPEKYIALDYDENTDEAIVEILKNSDKMNSEQGGISLETAQKELDFLMNYLKYYYGAYQYYGGDDVFIPLKDSIMNDFREEGTGFIKYSNYKYTLYKHLSGVITDCHFEIGDRYFRDTQRHKYFLKNTEYSFYLEGNKFYTDIEDKKYELISVDSLAPFDVLIPYLNKDGLMTRIIGHSSTTATMETSVIILYHEESREAIEQQIELTATPSVSGLGDSMYNEYELDGIQIVESRRCWLKADEQDMDVLMMESAIALRDKKVIIVDIRGNGGGNSTYPKIWLSNLLETDKISPIGVQSIRVTKTAYQVENQHPNLNWEDFLSWTGEYEGWSGPGFVGEKNENKDRLFIVLVDQNTGSAAEFFVDYLRQTENTIIVGTNTGGSFFTGNVNTIMLPYSKTSLRCGYFLSLEPDLSSIEAIGFQPDIWAPPNESLDRVIKFVSNYELTD